jgi:HPt (histidine-containing phosphotransfer) domain-containing protein
MSASPSPGPTASAAKKISIPRLRRLLLVVLTLSVIGFTAGVYVLVQRIFLNFGPGIEQDLIWKTVRGAQELAGAVDLGLAVKDPKLVADNFGELTRSDDVLAIAAVGADGSLVSSAGQLPESLHELFAGAPASPRRTPGYFVAWAPALIEGSAVGKVAVVVKTLRLVQAKALLRRMSLGTAAAGIIVLVLGVLFVNFFTGSIVERDAQLAEYASGLERKVALRTAELDHANQGMRLVLDNVQQGFITVSLDGIMARGRSTIVDRWFGPPPSDGKLSTLLRKHDETVAFWFDVGCEGLRDNYLPATVVLDQFPKQMVLGESTLRLSYIGIGAEETPKALLVVLSDVTAELARERIERDAREMTRTFQRITADRAGFEQFFAEAGGIVKEIRAGAADGDGEKRLIHTLKGNCRLFGIESVAESCHQLETQLHEEGRGATASELGRLGDDWDRVARLISGLLGDRRSIIELEELEYQDLLAALRAGTASDELLGLVESWRLELVSLRLARLADKARYMADRLNKPLNVHVKAAGLRLDGAEWTPFWTALVHAVNNAIDHGIEAVDVRKAQGKTAAGNLWLSAVETDGTMVISLRDDGRGIDWDRLRDKARAAGLLHGSRADLTAALFADGVTTNDEVGAFSGRGVGMGALRAAATSAGGHVEVISEPNQGTTIEFRFPRHPRGMASADQGGGGRVANDHKRGAAVAAQGDVSR